MDLPIYTEKKFLGSDEDNRWFAKRQHRNYRIRRLLPGEFQEIGFPTVHATHVAVRRFGKGIRFRLPCNPPKNQPNNEGSCKRYFNTLLRIYYAEHSTKLVRFLESFSE